MNSRTHKKPRPYDVYICAETGDERIVLTVEDGKITDSMDLAEFQSCVFLVDGFPEYSQQKTE